jgi:hypothetical protein
MALTIQGEKIIPAAVKKSKTMVRTEKETETNSSLSSLDFRLRYSEYIGIKETVSDPSPTSRRKRLGIRKATKKASVAVPAPKSWATIISLRKPKILERSVAPPTIPAALAIFSLVLIRPLRFSNQPFRKFCRKIRNFPGRIPLAAGLGSKSGIGGNSNLKDRGCPAIWKLEIVAPSLANLSRKPLTFEE